MVDSPLLLAFAALFGLVTGSFLNVCIYRLPRRLSVVTPRSFCPDCENTIAWYDNIPVISFVLLHRHCRKCKVSISWRYPFNEVATAALFCAVVYRWGVTPEALKWIVFGCVLIVLFWTDLETRLLPDFATLGALVCGLLFSAVVPLNSLLLDPLLNTFSPALRSILCSFAGAALLALPFLVFSELYARLRHIAPVGLGDIKLLALIGAFVGIERGLLILMIGSAAGALIGLGYIWGTGKNLRTEPVPYGSFLCAASLLVLFWGSQLFARWWHLGA
jgi:leader peptidase (prepilin peptidase) / N-methyltransferase